MTAILTFVVQVLVLVQPITSGPDQPRAVVSDGSVWADVGSQAPGGYALRSTQRLCDHDARASWLAADVDGDGRTDLVAVRFDSLGAHVKVWHNGIDGFARWPAAPHHLIRPTVRLVRDALAGLLGFDTPEA